MGRFVTILVPLIIAVFSTSFTAAAAGGEFVGESYVPTIWVDPDGCEHWVFDDGFEGYMTPHVTRDGRPVCQSGNTCAVLRSDQLFATDAARISTANKRKLQDFFAKVKAGSFIINGHTDSRASDAYNMALSERRASAVADVARAAGVKIFTVQGYGERVPKASNQTASGRASNRRVEVICVP